MCKAVPVFRQCAESLSRIQAGLSNTANKRERVKILHKKSESFYADSRPNFYLFLYDISYFLQFFFQFNIDMIINHQLIHHY